MDVEQENSNTSTIYGADLTSIAFPSSLVLAKSFLTIISECYASHFDMLIQANDTDSPKERMLRVYCYLISNLIQFNGATKKPRNPILGETFQGYVDYHNYHQHQEEGSCAAHRVFFFAEQVNHHPLGINVPIIYNRDVGISGNASLTVRSTFMGTFVRLAFEGDLCIRFDRYDQVKDKEHQRRKAKEMLTSGQKMSEEQVGITTSEVEMADEENNQSTFSLITSVLKKAKIGSDITDAPCPGALVLPKSFLTYCNETTTAHFDLLIKANEIDDEKERMLQVYRFVMSCLHLPEETTKRPLNPILGETYQGHRQFGVDGNPTEVHFFSEKIQPAISCHISYHKESRITVTSTTEFKCIFMGTYVKLINDGDTLIKLDRFNEVYTCSLAPMAIRVFRQFAEFFGDTELTNNKNDLRVKTTLLEKPLLFGSYNAVEATLYKGTEKLQKIKGTWDQELLINSTHSSKDFTTFLQRPALTPGQLILPPNLPENDSNRIWNPVFEAVAAGNPKNVNKEKSKIDQKEKAKLPQQKDWKPTHFQQINNQWIYIQN
ncbi:oxysterol binding family protein [Cavenderia fasciculata]|uniref:Oxysterol binding family protein n=1 Tax=Cavenderia fasciculata TaxID=261658 RepID=F4QF21_CACFS|nr:oxysterol binding family protein [Cavenderia fasciculata]EGG13380.1 oxysterol binding family protein [Cavenderia fasciculata]|eukprot:XP_004350084.1 oxysterol binding family protein [Cavenderia fasciculata]